ncbi:low molecular weight protein-tyrosine-phosphatase [Amaricoccus solimangrovi]|uniref:protein-tyrosine-phosphatase n=1 Tax=Amaricoccus solimangrovi TaxID=2589815 RepID=A0A501WWB6_9RHOB|nr:low molecular weight protein-tyrosine-phosphatase [Amaricoccus solimangrovi]TPE53569.1 low molecular weight phosphotyrosine protein phosphatase [Amaricoccus solimangrovi]
MPARSADRPAAVLLVCLGNICRSPLAEAALRAEAAAAGLALEIDSAGTGGWHVGEPPDPRARAVALARGIDIGGYRGRQVARADFARFDHIVALDHENLRALRALCPEGARARLSLLLDHVPGREGEPVADPYFGGPEGFETTWADVTAGAAGLIATLRGAG